MTVDSELQGLLSRYGIETDSGCAEQVRTYLSLLEKWNRRMNLVSSTSWNIVGPLLEEALWAGRLFPKRASLHLDIGSGGGFPALPMRLLNRDMQLCMVESRAKRAVFLETAIRELRLEGVRVHGCRLEEYLLGEGAGGGWDGISWKALKLDTSSLSLLVRRADRGAWFWVFHGHEIPVERGGEAISGLRLMRRDFVPGKPSWRLSIFERGSC